VVFGEEAADGLAIDLARGEVDETLAVLGAVLDLKRREGRKRSSAMSAVVGNAKKKRSRADHWECIDEVAVDGVEGARVVVRRRADSRQVDGLQIHHPSSSRRWEGKEFLSGSRTFWVPSAY
jgi:hypothetical protein